MTRILPYRYVVKADTLVEELSGTVERALEKLALREENRRLRLAHIPGSVTGIAATGLEPIQIPPPKASTLKAIYRRWKSTTCKPPYNPQGDGDVKPPTY